MPYAREKLSLWARWAAPGQYSRLRVGIRPDRMALVQHVSSVAIHI